MIINHELKNIAFLQKFLAIDVINTAIGQEKCVCGFSCHKPINLKWHIITQHVIELLYETQNKSDKSTSMENLNINKIIDGSPLIFD